MPSRRVLLFFFFRGESGRQNKKTRKHFENVHFLWLNWVPRAHGVQGNLFRHEEFALFFGREFDRASSGRLFLTRPKSMMPILNQQDFRRINKWKWMKVLNIIVKWRLNVVDTWTRQIRIRIRLQKYKPPISRILCLQKPSIAFRIFLFTRCKDETTFLQYQYHGWSGMMKMPDFDSRVHLSIETWCCSSTNSFRLFGCGGLLIHFFTPSITQNTASTLSLVEVFCDSKDNP